MASLRVCQLCGLPRKVAAPPFTSAFKRRYRNNNSNNGKNKPWPTAEFSQETVNVSVGESQVNISTGKLARIANGSAVVQHDNTAVLVTAVSKEKLSGVSSTVPLSVDYREKSTAGGRIPTNYVRRDTGSSEQEILTSRLIDRSVRPMFPEGYFNETQLTGIVLARDENQDPDVLSINAASTALALSDISWDGPVGAVRVGLVNNRVVINPNRKLRLKSSLDMIVVAAENNKVVMLECSGNSVPSILLVASVEMGVEAAQSVISGIKSLQESCGKGKKSSDPYPKERSEMIETIKRWSLNNIKDVLNDKSHHKVSRDLAIQKIRTSVVKGLQSLYTSVDYQMLHDTFSLVYKEAAKDQIFMEQKRCDGRSLNQMREISCEVDLYEPLHGSALFQRGQTQVMSTVTFDNLETNIKSDHISFLTGGKKEKNFLLHYEFPSQATNEISRAAGFISRREIGHAALAEKALRPVLPDDFPFNVRLTAEVLESNGSSSMASVCGGSLALMDAGVPISQHVAGTAIGLVTRMKPDEPQTLEDYRLLTDIMGLEDYFGDMDFKIAGTNDGITALQADIKLPGVPLSVIKGAVLKGAYANRELLSKMNKTLSQPRPSLKPCAPVYETLTVPYARRSEFFGTGYANPRSLMFATGARSAWKSKNSFQLYAPNQTAMDEAKAMIASFFNKKDDPNEKESWTQTRSSIGSAKESLPGGGFSRRERYRDGAVPDDTFPSRRPNEKPALHESAVNPRELSEVPKELEFGAIYEGQIVQLRNTGADVLIHPKLRPVFVSNSQLSTDTVDHPSDLGLNVGDWIHVKYFNIDPVTGRIRLSRTAVPDAKSFEKWPVNLITEDS